MSNCRLPQFIDPDSRGMRLLKWLLTNKRRVTLAVVVLTTFEILLTFLGGRPAIENMRAHTPRAALVAGPFLILLTMLIQTWAGKDPHRSLIDNAAYGMMLIWSVSYAFVVSTMFRV